MAALKVLRHALLRLLVLSLVALAGVHFYFVARIALMAVIAPESTAFERSEIYRITKTTGMLPWRQQWMPYAKISVNLQRAVIASEDASFTEHDGLDLEALEKAWEKNAVAQRRAQKIAEQQAAQAARQGKKPPPPVAQALAAKPVKVVGGSTITQQLAKNLFLSGERTLLRKGEELLLTLMLETLLDKQRILEIYLNSVEWGEGVFGAEAAAQYYFRKPAARLSPYEAARLAVMLPRPRYFETRPNSDYLTTRANVIVARMGSVNLP